jgi:DNA-binding transcriptional regulator GbsR (MarR family)
MQTFIEHFGHMGSRWGINRTVGQVYAVLFLANTPLNADQIVAALNVSRSNVAMSLKELSSMNLLIPQHVPGDRKDYYGTHEDIWDIVRALVEERRQREIQPTLSVLRSIILSPSNSSEESYAQHRIQEMHDVIDMLTNWYSEMEQVDTDRLISLMKLGARVFQLFQMKDKLLNRDESKTKQDKSP